MKFSFIHNNCVAVDVKNEYNNERVYDLSEMIKIELVMNSISRDKIDRIK